ncbi:MAG: uroporphyrinogen decarboxylase family protein [Candidatus Atabeyarchaeum deiterrae]
MTEEAMSPRERIEAVKSLKVPDRVPVVPLIDFVAPKIAGVKMSDFIFNDEVANKAIQVTFEKLGGWDEIFPPQIITMSAFSLKSKAPGRDLPDDALLQVCDEEIMKLDDYDLMVKKGFTASLLELLNRVGNKDSAARILGLGNVIKSLRTTWDKLGIPISCGALCFVPVELFSFYRSVQKILLDMHRYPDKIIKASNAVINEEIGLAKSTCLVSGVKTVFVGAQRTSCSFVSPKMFEQLTLPSLKKIVENLHKDGFHTLLHFDCNWTLMLEYLLQLPKASCTLELDGQTDIFKAKKVLGDHMCIMGDVPAPFFRLGTTNEVEKYCIRLIKEVGEGGGFILSSGCSVPVDAKLENIKAMIDTAKKYGAYRK